MLAADAAALLLVRRWPDVRGVLVGAVVAVVACFALAVIIAAAGSSHAGFAVMRYCAFGTFAHGPLLLAGGALMLRERRAWRIGLPTVAVLVLAIAVDAFWIEPTAIGLRRFEVRTTKLSRPIRIGLLADLQTDDVGDYERRALEMLLTEKPDLILFAGDYAHVLDQDERDEQWARINELFLELNVAAPLGVYAVQGDVDGTGWERVFAGIEAEIFYGTRTVEGEEVTVTGLSYSDGSYPELGVDAREGFHIVLGHRPDFALGEVQADLLVAGHTHGGQVQLPFLGPPITLARIPRGWADGLTHLSGGRTLVVSRGVGMERGRAPRLRFLCRPEIIVIDVVPAGRG